MDLLDYRQQIDQLDSQLVELFCRRMDICAKIAEYKQEQGLPVFHPEREQEKLRTVAALAGPRLAKEAQVLYTTLLELSRSHQNRLIGEASQLFTAAVAENPDPLPKAPEGACPGNDTEVI